MPAESTSSLGEVELLSRDHFGDRYLVTGRLGSGATSTVYEARHTTTGAPVAIKHLNQPEGAHATQRSVDFSREASLTARLTHPNTVRVFDFDQTGDGRPFLVMERLTGETLRALLDRHGSAGIDEDLTVQIARAVLGSLSEAHALGLVHRDIKPTNIMLHRMASGETAIKLLDFGLATPKRLGEVWIVGTPRYMSPEQCQGRDVDGRSDLYSLGVVLYECLAGQPPFAGVSYRELAVQHERAIPEPLAELVTQRVRPGFVALIHDALAKSPTDRPSDALTMLHKVEMLTTTVAQRDDEVAVPTRRRLHTDTEPGVTVSPSDPRRVTGMPVDRPARHVKRQGSLRRKTEQHRTPVEATRHRPRQGTEEGVEPMDHAAMLDTVDVRQDGLQTVDQRSDRRRISDTDTVPKRRKAAIVSAMTTSEAPKPRRRTRLDRSAAASAAARVEADGPGLEPGEDP